MQQEKTTNVVRSEKSKKVLNIEGEEYTVQKCLGSGAFGKIYLIEKDNEKYALKAVNKKKLSDEDNRRTRLELKLLLSLAKSSFIVDLHKGFESEKTHVFVLKYCVGGDLFTRVVDFGNLDEDAARFYLGEIAVAVEVIHRSGHIHRDLKLENVLINADGHIVLADFGLSKRYDDNVDMAYCGTLAYMAPEMVHKEEYNMAIDIWAIGIMAFEMLTSYNPFDSELGNMKDRIKFEDPEFPEPNILSNEAIDFIKRLLVKDSRKRPYVWEGDASHFESYHLKKDVFFGKLKWNKLVDRQLTPPFIPFNQGPP